MNQFCHNLHQEMEHELMMLQKVESRLLTQYEKAAKIILHYLGILKERTVQHSFDSDSEEILFFKYLKPRFTSMLLYYQGMYQIESSKPYTTIKLLRKYYKHELHKIQLYYSENNDFNKYYRTDNVHLDHRYFRRGNYDLCLTPPLFHFDADQRFSTSHDYKVASLLANEKIQIYIENEIHKLQRDDSSEQISELKSDHRWTGSKVSLIELIYALQSEGVLNDGKSDLKDVVTLFESVFNIDLGQYHRSFLEIRGRKIERTRFLCTLRDRLVKRMDEADERI